MISTKKEFIFRSLIPFHELLKAHFIFVRNNKVLNALNVSLNLCYILDDKRRKTHRREAREKKKRIASNLKNDSLTPFPSGDDILKFNKQYLTTQIEIPFQQKN